MVSKGAPHRKGRGTRTSWHRPRTGTPREIVHAVAVAGLNRRCRVRGTRRRRVELLPVGLASARQEQVDLRRRSSPSGRASIICSADAAVPPSKRPRPANPSNSTDRFGVKLAGRHRGEPDGVLLQDPVLVHRLRLRRIQQSCVSTLRHLSPEAYRGGPAGPGTPRLQRTLVRVSASSQRIH